MRQYPGKESSSLNSIFPQMRVLTNMYEIVENEKIKVTKNIIIVYSISLVMLIISILLLDIRTSIEYVGVLFFDFYTFYVFLNMTQLVDEYKYIKSNDYVINGINISTMDELTKSLFKKQGYAILYQKIFKYIQFVKIFILVIGIISKVLSYLL